MTDDFTTNAPAQLRAAAQRLRALAEAAPAAPWRTRWFGQQLVLLDANQPDPGPYPGPDPDCVTEWTYAVRTWEPEASEDRAECETGFPDYLTAMHPGIAVALAGVFDAYAHRLEHPIVLALARMGGKSGMRDAVEVEHASILDLARLVLKGQS